MWKYRISTGTLSQNGVFVGSGYSGSGPPDGPYRNNVMAQSEVGKGPIPEGLYTIGPVRASDTLGPVVMNLDPAPSTDTHGRSLFRIHGDNARHDASHGCIILGPSIRQEIAHSTDKTLIVVP